MLTPFNSGYLPKVDGHEIFFAEYGNREGEAILTIHGGPGSHHKPRHVECLDLNKYCVIAFDQRGCGLSKYDDLLKENNTQKILDDAERLRIYLKISSWFVAGSSWGSTLALAYAEKYPSSVKGILLSSIFLGRKSDDDWAFGGKGANELFPDLWDQTKSSLSVAELLNEIEHAELSKRNELVAKVLSWEGNLMTSQSDIAITDPSEVTDEYLAMVKISLHYNTHDYFLEDNEILNKISSIKEIPTVIVHGRYDILCPANGAYTLHKSLNNSELIMLPSSNHKLSADGAVTSV